MVDMTVQGVVTGQRTVGEFGEPVRLGPELVSPLIGVSDRTKLIYSHQRFSLLGVIRKIGTLKSLRFIHTLSDQLQEMTQTQAGVRARTGMSSTIEQSVASECRLH
jgi:hypothetical protein